MVLQRNVREVTVSDKESGRTPLSLGTLSFPSPYNRFSVQYQYQVLINILDRCQGAHTKYELDTKMFYRRGLLYGVISDNTNANTMSHGLPLVFVELQYPTSNVRNSFGCWVIKKKIYSVF